MTSHGPRTLQETPTEWKTETESYQWTDASKVHHNRTKGEFKIFSSLRLLPTKRIKSKAIWRISQDESVVVWAGFPLIETGVKLETHILRLNLTDRPLKREVEVQDLMAVYFISYYSIIISFDLIEMPSLD